MLKAKGLQWVQGEALAGSRAEPLVAHVRFENVYFYFHRALDILSEDPVRQCETMGYYNVAWELCDAASSGAHTVLNLPGGQLSVEQRELISRILQDLDSLPDNAFMVETTREAHIRAMNSESWAAIRQQAIVLRTIMQPETERVKAILWPSESDDSGR